MFNKINPYKAEIFNKINRYKAEMFNKINPYKAEMFTVPRISSSEESNFKYL